MKSRVMASGTLAAALLLAACGAEPLEVQPVAAEDLAAEVAERVAQEIGYEPEVSCPEDLPAEVDATVTCDLTAPTSTIPATVTVTAVDEETGTVTFDVHVDAPTPEG